jgi:hypothetical protein
MSLPACLVTSSPSFEEPERTPPFLMAQSARPDIRQIKVVDTTGGPVEFAAVVRSEDNGADVYGHLVLDYGVTPPGGPDYQPYLLQLKSPFNIEPGTLGETTPRTLSAEWFPGSIMAPAGCHTVTLFAMHDVNFQNGCPNDSNDFDFLTWIVVVCSGSSCCDPKLPPDQERSCKNLQCPDTDPDIRCDTVAPPPGGSSQSIFLQEQEAQYE